MRFLFIVLALLSACSLDRVPFRAPRDSRLLEVKKGDAVDEAAWKWNEQQRDAACVADKDMPDLGAHKGDHIICSTTAAQPGPPPEGYCVIYYTSGCSTCAVGWVYARGSRCENCLNCAN